MENERDRAQKVLGAAETRLARTVESLKAAKIEKQELMDLHAQAMQSDDKDAAITAAIELAERKFTTELVTEKEAYARKLASANERIEYMQNSYREASSQVGALQAEKDALELRIRDLASRANDNVVTIHRLNVEAQRAQLLAMYEQERGLRLEREKEIERKNEEIRGLKARFGGRETRGSSVPRSPRIRGSMGSRNTSPVGDFGGGGGGAGNGFLGPRGAHLREG